MHWSDEGVASWYDIAYELGQLGEKYCLFPKAAEVIPISSDEYKTLASRPFYSVLDCTKTKNILTFIMIFVLTVCAPPQGQPVPKVKSTPIFKLSGNFSFV